MFAVLGLVGCGHPASRPGAGEAASGVETTLTDAVRSDATAQPAAADSPAQTPGRVEVLSFHGRQRCPTCRAIEQLTREVVEGEFAREVADGTVVLRVVEIEAEPALAERYRVVWSSLLLQGRDTVVDLTRRAFDTARRRSDEFRATLRSEIENLLER